jgi:hypothetical protein
MGDREDDRYQKREWVEAIRAGTPQIAASKFDFAGRPREV